MIVLSILIMPNILGYIRELLHFWILIYFYKQLLNCLNIIQIVALITKLDYDKLDFLVFKTSLIPKIIVFIN